MVEGKVPNVELKEPTKEPVRLISKREPITVEIPTEVVGKDDYLEVPKSFIITPMTRSQAMLRDRIKKRLSNAEKEAIVKCGVSVQDYNEMNKSIFRLAFMLSSNSPKEEIEQEKAKHNKKYESIANRLFSIDRSKIEEIEDELIEQSVTVFVDNVHSISMEDGEIDINKDTVDCVHPDLFRFIIAKIEENSYLKEGEILGL